jgi:hypothetical protein
MPSMVSVTLSRVMAVWFGIEIASSFRLHAESKG